MDENYFSIGDVSELLNIPSSTIRYWDAEGLISSKRNDTNGYRIFDIDDIFKIYDIYFYRNLDIPVKKMGNLYQKSPEELYQTLEVTQKKIEEAIQENKRRLEEIHFRKNHLKLIIDNERLPQNIRPDFTRILKSDFEETHVIKSYLNKQLILGICNQSDDLENLEYGFCVTEDWKISEKEEVLWTYDENAHYYSFLLKVNGDYPSENNLPEIKKLMEKEGYQTGIVFGEYLFRSLSEQNIYIDYYQGWLEIFR
jgi:DNA-binding transcriptional MerR regulator